jgi:hypothetical protein
MTETQRSPSETLMAALEIVEDAQELMIIQVHASGDISWTATSDSAHKRLGMLEFVKQALIKSYFGPESE